MNKNLNFALSVLFGLAVCLPAVAATAKLANKTGKTITLDVPPANEASWKLKADKKLVKLDRDRSSITMANKDEIVMEITSRSVGGDIWFSLTDPAGQELKYKYPRVKSKWEAMPDNPGSSMKVTIGSGDNITLQ